MTVGDVVGVMGAGAVGAPARYLVDALVAQRTTGPFPWGTLVINISGSVLLGFITGLVLFHALPSAPRIVLGTGFCGAYTTFSTFSFESVRLAEEDSLGPAIANLAASVVAGMAGAALGLVLAAAA